MKGVAVALTLMLAAAPAAMAQEPAPTGGTSASSTPSDGTTTEPAPAPGDASAPATVSPTATVKLTRTQTKRVQKRVRVRADGSVGARTRTAIRKYQAKKRLTRTGRPNLETIRAMKMPFVAAVEAKLAATSTTRSANGAPAPAAPGSAAAAVEAARSAIGTPYASAGTTTSGFDCSGLTMWAFEQAGITLPRTSFDQYGEGTAVERTAIQAGDLVFFDTNGPGASHVGVATSPTTVISATTRGVMEHRIDDDYWGAAYVGARRIAAA